MLKKILILSIVFSVLAVFAADSTKHQVNPEKCIGCTLCVQNCPVKAIQMVAGKAVIDPAKCINCGICASKCPVKAINGPALEKSKEPEKKEIKPAGDKKKVSFKVDLNKCTGCTECVSSCPAKAISIVRGKAVIDSEKCISCGLCANSCRYSAPSGSGI